MAPCWRMVLSQTWEPAGASPLECSSHGSSSSPALQHLLDSVPEFWSSWSSLLPANGTGWARAGARRGGENAAPPSQLLSLVLSAPSQLCTQERAHPSPCCRKPAQHTLASSPDTGKSRAGRLGSSPRDTVCSQCQLSDVQADPSATRPICVTKLRSSQLCSNPAGRRQPGGCARCLQGRGTVGRRQQSSNPGLRNERTPCTPVIHGKVTGAQAGPERPTVTLCILPALECQPSSSSEEKCHVPSFPGSPL